MRILSWYILINKLQQDLGLYFFYRNKDTCYITSKYEKINLRIKKINKFLKFDIKYSIIS